MTGPEDFKPSIVKGIKTKDNAKTPDQIDISTLVGKTILSSEMGELKIDKISPEKGLVFLSSPDGMKVNRSIEEVEEKIRSGRIEIKKG